MSNSVARIARIRIAHCLDVEQIDPLDELVDARIDALLCASREHSFFLFFSKPHKKIKNKRQIEKASSPKKIIDRPSATCCACGTAFFASFLQRGSAFFATKMSCAE